MAISATGYAGNGIGATITAVLGADDSTAEISIGLSAAIIENKTEYEDLFSADFFLNEYEAIIDGAFVTISNDTGKDGGKGLVDDLKGIFNSIVSDEKFELDTAYPFYGTKVSEEDIDETYGAVVAQAGETYGFVDAGYGLNFYIEAVEGSTVYVVNAKGTEAVAQWVVNPMIGPRPVQDMAVVMAESNDEAVFTVAEGQTGLMFTVYGVADKATAFAVRVEEPAEPLDTIALLPGETTTPAFVQGTSMADPGITTYIYEYEATADCTVTITYDEDVASIDKLTVVDEQVFGSEWIESGTVITLSAGDVLYIGASNANWGTDAVTFTVTIA